MSDDDDWDRTVFDADLKAILDAKLPVSASKITGLQSLALKHPKHHNYIVHCIVRFIETSPPDYRLAGLYVVDAISRAVQKMQRKGQEEGKPVEAEGYLRRFGVVLKDESLRGAFAKCSDHDKDKVRKTLGIWENGGVYSKSLVEYLKRSLLSAETSPPSDVKETVQTSKGAYHKLQSHAASPPADTAQLLANLRALTESGQLPQLTGISTAASPPPEAVSVEQPSTPGLPPVLARLFGSGASVSPQQAGTGASATTAGATTATPPPTQYAPSQPFPMSPTGMAFQPPPAQQAPPPFMQGQPPYAPFPLGGGRPPMGSRPPMGNVPPMGRPPMPPMPPSMHNRPPPLGPLGMRPPTANYHARPNAPYDEWNPRDGRRPYSRDRSMSPPPRHDTRRRDRPSRWRDDDEQRRPARSISPQHDRRSHDHRPPPPFRGGDRGAFAKPTHDPTIPAGTIRVLTRTLFVGPLPESFRQEDVRNHFSQFGEICSIILSRKGKSNRPNAFIKFRLRSSTEAAKEESANLHLQGGRVKVNWAYGFGPKKLFNYDRGDSIIPLSSLTPSDEASLVSAPLGGFQGAPLRDQMTVEEPEVDYRPDWVKEQNIHAQPQPNRGPPRDMPFRPPPTQPVQNFQPSFASNNHHYPSHPFS
ncbi:hypothetical protein BCR43DRAFT_273468 [Syncephalastrum racemosum]|uniref:Uncharacterized protein n=1 Tax=Syncephalastrum racemosum TaxID=13706 RepID=A0A1X2HC26_SYNRA|nr:hypothetical protein BCR43DRAFT_273468 [Syncephalastrum racemosum]